MRKRIDYRRVGRQILIFLFILILGLLNLRARAQVIYSEDFTASPNGTNSSPKWEVNTGNTTPDLFWVNSNQFDCKNTQGEVVWTSSLIDISGYDAVNASISLTEKGQMDPDDFIRVYYNVDGKGEILFSDHGNNEGTFGTVWAKQAEISGSDLQIIIHIKNNQPNERHSFDNIRVEGRPQSFTWLGTKDSIWNDAANWSLKSVPSINDDVLIGAKALIRSVITGAAECKSLRIENNATLVMSAGSVLKISGDMTCSGKFIAGKGTVKLVGDDPQMIVSDKEVSFHNLDIVNHSDDGVKTGAKIYVRGNLTLSDGILNANHVVMTNSAPGAITTYSDSSYINGKLEREINKGEGSYTFPVGMGGRSHYHPARIDVHALEGTKALTVSFEPHHSHTPASLNTKGSEFAFDSYISEGMWVIAPDAEPLTGWYDIRLSLENISGLKDNLFGVLKRPYGGDEKAWTANFGNENVFGGDGRKLSDGYALKKYCTAFSEFTLGGGGIAIPIELLGFDANLVAGKVNIKWSTATETNNNYFTIEKSNGTDFKEVVKVNSNGNSSSLQTYTAVDEKPFTGVSYYRLKQTDFNGKEEYSDVVSVKNASDTQFILFPNPAEGSVKLKFNSSLPKVEVVVYNQHGTVSYNKTFVTQGASSVVELQLKDELAAGIYYIQVSANEQDMMIQQIVIQ